MVDAGAHTLESLDDYPVFARAVCEALLRGDAGKGIIICGSGVGASIAANKFPGIRASVCHDTYSAHQGVEHDDMNVLCMGARIIGEELAKEIGERFAAAEFSNAERHVRRLNEVKEIESQFMQSDSPQEDRREKT
jgi:ribose 5-phosphate isomerase B